MCQNYYCLHAQADICMHVCCFFVDALRICAMVNLVRGGAVGPSLAPAFPSTSADPRLCHSGNGNAASGIGWGVPERSREVQCKLYYFHPFRHDRQGHEPAQHNQEALKLMKAIENSYQHRPTVRPTSTSTSALATSINPRALHP